MDKSFSFIYKSLKSNELSNVQLRLIDACKNAVRGSYAPYSNFNVGAAVLLENDIIVTGANQENVAYPSGMCAERIAMFAANAGYPDSAPIALAIAACKNGIFTDKPVTPCGACRQVLIESEKRFGRSIQILLYGTEEIILIDNVADLLPLSFEF